MSEAQAGGPSILERAKNMLLKPKSEWEKIDAEPMTVGGIFTGWVLILAAIPAVAGLIGMQLFGIGYGFVSFRPSLGFSLSMAITQYVTGVLGVFVLALIIDALAPTFGGTRNQVQATKVAAFSATAAMVAGIFMLIPQLGALMALLGALYGLYLLYLGLPLLMKVAAEKALAYVAAAIVAAIVIWLILGAVTNAVTRAFMGPRVISPVAELSNTVTIPGASPEVVELVRRAAEDRG